MVFEDDPPSQHLRPNSFEKWGQQATTSAFGIMESLRGQGSSFAKNLKSFGKNLLKESNSASSPSTPAEHRDDDIRLTWLTNRIVLADTLHTSKEGLLSAERAVVREMIDCQPYVVVNVHAEPLKLDGYAKSIHIPLGVSAKGGVPSQPTIQALTPILNEYCLLTNDAAIVFFGADENVVIAAAFCLIASKSVQKVSDFLSDSIQSRYTRLPTTYKLFIEQTISVVKSLINGETPSVGIVLNALIIEPGNVVIDGELYASIQQGVNHLKIVEFSANECRNRNGQLVVKFQNFEILDDVVISIGQKTNAKSPLFTARFNTQLLESEDSDIVLTGDIMDVSRLVAQPVQDLRMIVNFATRRAPTLTNMQFDRYKLLCVRNEKELEGYQRSYGYVSGSDEESPILRSKPKPQKKTNGDQESSSFFDTLQFEDSAPQRTENLLNTEENNVDLLGGFQSGTNISSPSTADLLSTTPKETPILSAPTPLASEYEPAIDDLLGLGGSKSSESNQSTLVDFDFGAPIKPTNSSSNLSSSPIPPASNQPSSNFDLLGSFSPLKPTSTATPPNSMASSAANSKPVSTVNSQSDFEAFLSNYPEKQQPTRSVPPSANKQKTIPQTQPAFKPAFGEAPSTGPKVSFDAFSDLLGKEGFKPTAREAQKKSIGALLNAEQAKNLTPEEVKIRDWTQGKERNIRALLGSLHNVLWEGADRWNQPSMADLLSPDQIKKQYRKACLVVHPDKLTGSPNLTLAKLIFTELNDAYSKYQNDPNIS
ncbi:unnamed protein product [Caenorhabditis angaria]|uniref:J domain-containing protein n=1 Tax=Caenorhabditis angaria TaxID=860376 RepID=A0A9P1N7S8_9PELO|nr:unnamed protein product [Caenorhabditis angaria]